MLNTDRKNMENTSTIENFTSDKFVIECYTPSRQVSTEQHDQLVNFLHQHLDQFGDPKKDISACIDYAMQFTPSPGGFILAMEDAKKIIGAVIVNKTGMKGYIPENILVYIALHSEYRGQGLGKLLMQTALNTADGDVALHVEPDNPAKFLYEKLGFENKYLEMRYKRY